MANGDALCKFSRSINEASVELRVAERLVEKARQVYTFKYEVAYKKYLDESIEERKLSCTV